MKNKIISIGLLTILLISMLTSNHSQAQENSLIAEYHFDEGQGSMLTDSSGFDNHGSIFGAVWVDGISGSALNFDGIDDHVTCGHSLTGDILTEMSVSVWINIENVYEDNWIFYDGSDGEFWLGARFNRTLFFQMKDMFNVFHPVHTNPIIVNNTWFHVAGVYNGSSLKIYVNGQLSNEISFNYASPKLPSGDYFPTIGAYSGPSNNIAAALNGTIDELTIYNRALSSDEIKSKYDEMMENQTPGFELWIIVVASLLAFATMTGLRKRRE